MVFHNHTHSTATKRWPDLNHIDSGSELLRHLASFGPVKLDIVTLNLESTSSNLPLLRELDKIPNVATTMHVAFGARHSKLIELEQTTDLPVNVTASLKELREASKTIEREGTTPSGDVFHYAYAMAKLYDNKTTSQDFTNGGFKITPNSERICMVPIYPGKMATNIWETLGRTIMDWLPYGVESDDVGDNMPLYDD